MRRQATTDAKYRKRIQSLQAVDRSIGKLITTLKNNGQLANTYIVFTSDNGFHLGQHRLPAGKQTAYDTDIHVPLLIRLPGGQHGGRRVAARASLVDLAPTSPLRRRERAGVRRRALVRPAGDEPTGVEHLASRYLVEH
jgi:membrane-anchored protein YejM (alkaline phosphatase superfamily)